jgi:hypothetical protein
MYHISKLMMAVKEISVKSQALLGISIFLVLFYLVKLILSRTKRMDFPVVEAPIWDYKSAVVGGTLKVCAIFLLSNIRTINLELSADPTSKVPGYAFHTRREGNPSDLHP